MKNITEYDKDIINQWFNDSRRKDGVASLDELYRHLTKDYRHDYGTCCIAIAAIAVAAIRKMSSEFGITGFQHGAVMWEIITREFYTHNEIGLRIMDFDNLLYPQMQHTFSSVEISKIQANKIREKAKSLVLDEGLSHPDVRAWWEKLATGWLPNYVKVIKDN